ncbi:MAG: leucyl aminopeptidase [bacterium]|nr:leucyl aminopeptidase [bacterium]
MKFSPTAEKRSVKIRFIEGAVSRYTDKELRVATGQGEDLRQHLPGLRSRLFKPSPLTQRKFILLMRKVVAVAKQNKIPSIAIDFKDIKSFAPKSFSDNEVGKVAATAFVMADYEHTAYKTKPKGGFTEVEVVAVLGTPKEAKPSSAQGYGRAGAVSGLKRGQIIGEEVNTCRELCNTPGGDMTPKILAQAAKKAVQGTKARVRVLGRKEMQKLGMGAVLGMAKGSAEEPQFTVVEYWGKSAGLTYGTQVKPADKPVVLIGKGVTFDTGGLNIKGGDHMYEMHMDMSGGAAVIHAVALAAKLKLKTNVVALVPAVENAPGQGAVRPGDILKSLSGKTIEVLNTDAEGRVILADALTYAKRYNPACVVDVATLTGAALVALGVQCSGLMSNEQKFEDELRALGEESGDYLWPFPLWEEYEGMTKGTFGDVPNISTEGNSRDGGVIAGGMFLLQFAKELNCPWAHIDMAPRMTAAPNEFLAKGAAGAPVRLLFALIEHYANQR